jgi:hypothetical protein
VPLNDGGAGFTNGVNNDQVGGLAAPIDQLLGPLANNGGQTQTHALLPNSPALDAGNNCVVDNSCSPAVGQSLTTDHRGAGFARAADSADANATQTVDIGAFEAQASLEDITNEATAEDTPLSFSFNIGDAALVTSVTASSGNPAVVPNDPANLNVTGSGSTRTLNITPGANQAGLAVITVTVNTATASMSDTFVLTANRIADTPSVTNATTVEDTQTKALRKQCCLNPEVRRSIPATRRICRPTHSMSMATATQPNLCRWTNVVSHGSLGSTLIWVQSRPIPK